MSDAIKDITFIIERAGRTSSQFPNLIKEWRDAPKEVQFLIEDIQSSRHIARQLQRLWEHSAGHNLHGLDAAHALYAQYRRSDFIWSELDEIAHSIVGATGISLTGLSFGTIRLAHDLAWVAPQYKKDPTTGKAIIILWKQEGKRKKGTEGLPVLWSWIHLSKPQIEIFIEAEKVVQVLNALRGGLSKKLRIRLVLGFQLWNCVVGRVEGTRFIACYINPRDGFGCGKYES